jgi:hypothetical protein
MARNIPIARDTVCMVCGQAVQLLQWRDGVALFDHQAERRPHRCPAEALDRFESVFDRARKLLLSSLSRKE